MGGDLVHFHGISGTVAPDHPDYQMNGTILGCNIRWSGDTIKSNCSTSALSTIMRTNLINTPRFSNSFIRFDERDHVTIGDFQTLEKPDLQTE